MNYLSDVFLDELNHGHGLKHAFRGDHDRGRYGHALHDHHDRDRDDGKV